jgi:hypothetical protein
MGAIAATLVKSGFQGNLRYKIFTATAVNTNTSITVATGFKRILYHNICPPGVAEKYVTTQAVSGGSITYTITNPGTGGTETFTIKAVSDI